MHQSAVRSLFTSVQSLSRVQHCDPMDCSTPGLPVHHQLPELTQIRVHRVSDAMQPPNPLLSPSPPAFNLSQNQGLFQWVSSSHQVAKVLEFQASASVLPMNAVTSLQSCPTLYDPIDGSPPGSPIPGILQARTLEWARQHIKKQRHYFVNKGPSS